MERLDKLIANSGTLSRKEVQKLIKNGAVKVNGIITKDRGFCVDPDNVSVTVNGEEFLLRKYVYIMLNKPEGVVSAARDDKEKTVIDLVPQEYKKKNLFPAGRLDRNTTGFVLITDDGDFAHNILSPKNHVEKTYEARLAESITEPALQKISEGITLGDGTECLPAKLKVLEDGENPLVEVKICEGKYHQIKRMFAAAGNAVIELKRVKIGDLPLDENLRAGECKILSQDEVKLIRDIK
ncbi:MAG: rRNA pseudouridine synthase [Clostridia bacterium]|nr:rRNA pseudouridine synthase [Clostridia bacterium]